MYFKSIVSNATVILRPFGYPKRGLVYNLDKKTLAKMNADLGRDVEADDDLTYTTAEDSNDLA